MSFLYYLCFSVQSGIPLLHILNIFFASFSDLFVTSLSVYFNQTPSRKPRSNNRMSKYNYKQPENGLSESMMIVRRELGMNEKSVKRDVGRLSKWLKEQPELPDKLEGVDTDLWLENYLIMNKNDVERAKENLATYFQLNSHIPEVMVADRDPFSRKEMIQAFETTIVAMMPTTMENGFKVGVFMHRANTLTSEYNPTGMAMMLTCIADYYLSMGHDFTKIVVVVDLEMLQLGHLAKYPLRAMRRFFLYAWKAYPERVAQINIINPPKILSVALTLFKPFLKQKIRNRIVVHRNLDSLIENVPLKYLPKEYGGEYPSLVELHEEWRTKLANHQEYFRVRVNKHVTLNTERT
ncbi:alpha-tocopherol transfer protein-like [Daktulosphaira vitifoliae]|uniref:alpha-tocopherol transfer protein-like n=1 Tax=Daktulosphaira vitifoliae TaxID=58002 RepID=UPI0021A97A22|nr:alpha-tocopherol transfer protein-like [Daktulosphaira vitifoliae]